MIFVILGTEHFQFNRFVKNVEHLVENDVLTEEVFIQLGMSQYEPKHVGFKRFLPFSEMSHKIKNASLVLAHAGAGTTILSLQLGKAPILFPRLSKYGEHIDEHQATFAEKMKQKGYVHVAYDYSQLKDSIIKAKTVPFSPPRSNRGELVNFLKGVI